MQQSVFITGNSSGLGLGLSEEYLARGWQVYGLSRHGNPDLSGDLHDIQCDLNNQSEIVPALNSLLVNVRQLDIVYLNAGIFGELKRLVDITQEHLERVMNINIWANKIITDWLLASDIKTTQIIAISSGAAISANKGWGAYSLSKVSLNKLMALYAVEYGETHFCALAPGLVDTAMQDYLCDESGELRKEFPGLNKFREARGTDLMPTPREVAKSIASVTPRILKIPSGSFADIRTM
jgi:benzil reductase ((S)-benzoin forming)